MNKNQMKIDFVISTIKAEVAGIDPAPWRAVFEDDGDLVIWFHAKLSDDPRRVITAYADKLPSRNERNAAAFLVHSREYCQLLIAEIERLQAKLADEATS